MWKTVKVAACQIKIGRVAEVGTAQKWAVTPTCSFSIPVDGKFDEYGRAIIDGESPAQWCGCQNIAEFRLVMQGGRIQQAFDQLVCKEHFAACYERLENDAQELSIRYCYECQHLQPDFQNLGQALLSGTSVRLACGKGYWEMPDYNGPCDRERALNFVKKANECPDFEEVDYESIK